MMTLLLHWGAVLSSFACHFPRTRPHFSTSKISLFFEFLGTEKIKINRKQNKKESKEMYLNIIFSSFPHREVKFVSSPSFMSTFIWSLSLVNSIYSIPLESLTTSPCPLPQSPFCSVAPSDYRIKFTPFSMTHRPFTI